MGTRVTLIKSGTNGSFRSNRVISFKYQVLRMQLKLLIYKGFCSTGRGELGGWVGWGGVVHMIKTQGKGRGRVE